MRSAFSIDVPSGFVVCAFADPMRREVHTKGDLPPEIEGIVQPVVTVEVEARMTPLRNSTHTVPGPESATLTRSNTR